MACLNIVMNSWKSAPACLLLCSQACITSACLDITAEFLTSGSSCFSPHRLCMRLQGCKLRTVCHHLSISRMPPMQKHQTAWTRCINMRHGMVRRCSTGLLNMDGGEMCQGCWNVQSMFRSKGPEGFGLRRKSESVCSISRAPSQCDTTSSGVSAPDMLWSLNHIASMASNFGCRACMKQQGARHVLLPQLCSDQLWLYWSSTGL